MISEKFVILAMILSVVGGLGYLYKAARGQIQPHRVTMLLWSTISVVVFLAQRSENVGVAAYFALANSLIPLMVFSVSFVNPRARWAVQRFDLVCGAMSLASILAWLATNNPIVGIILSLMANALAGVPMLIKAYKYPHTETIIGFSLSAIASVMTLLTLEEWTFAAYAFPAYLGASNLALTIIIKRDRIPLLRQANPIESSAGVNPILADITEPKTATNADSTTL